MLPSMDRTKSTLLSFLLIAHLPITAQVVINEVSASNFSAYADNFGEFEDWIELYNTTAAPVDVSGWYLSDNQTNPTLWPIPAGTIIGANARQVFFASGRNTSGGGYFHTNFKLNQTSADWVVLADAGAPSWTTSSSPTVARATTAGDAPPTARPPGRCSLTPSPGASERRGQSRVRGETRCSASPRVLPRELSASA